MLAINIISPPFTAPIGSPPRHITMQKSRGPGALTGCPATSRRWWYLPYAVVGL